MASKWSFLKNKYPALPTDPSYDEVVLAAMAPHRGKPLEEIAVALNAREEEKADLDEKLSGVNAEITALERLMIEGFESSGVERIKVGGYNFSVQYSPAPKVTDPQTFRAWIDEHAPDVLSVNAQTLKGMVARALESGEEPLPEGIEVNVRTAISRRK